MYTTLQKFGVGKMFLNEVSYSLMLFYQKYSKNTVKWFKSSFLISLKQIILAKLLNGGV